MKKRHLSIFEKIFIVLFSATFYFAIFCLFMVRYFCPDLKESALALFSSSVDSKIVISGYDSYLVLYEVDGVSYKYEAYKPSEIIGDKEVNIKFTVRYIPWQPEYSVVDELETVESPFGFFKTLAMIFFLLLVCVYIYSLLDRNYILEHGEIVYGKFLRDEIIEKKDDDKIIQTVKMFFTFEDKLGHQRAIDREVSLEKAEKDQEFVKIIYVLYDDVLDSDGVPHIVIEFLDSFPFFIQEKISPEFDKLTNNTALSDS